MDQQSPPEEPPPTGENLLDQVSREKLSPLYSREELGVVALALVKFFTPTTHFTWYTSEFDGKDVFFGLVDGLELELGYFLLKELQAVRGPIGLLIERYLYYEPKKLRVLIEEHEQERRGWRYKNPKRVLVCELLHDFRVLFFKYNQWDMRGTFLREREQWETSINHPTKHVKTQIISQ